MGLFLLIMPSLLALGLEPVTLLYGETAVVIRRQRFLRFMVLPITSSIGRISPSLEEAAQNLGASGDQGAETPSYGLKLASSGLRSVDAGANGCASIDCYEAA